MIGIDWSNVLINGALISGGIILGAGILIGGSMRVGRHLANCQKAQTKVIPETVDEQFVFAGRPNYAGLRDRVKQLQADEVARLG